MFDLSIFLRGLLRSNIAKGSALFYSSTYLLYSTVYSSMYKVGMLHFTCSRNMRARHALNTMGSKSLKLNSHFFLPLHNFKVRLHVLLFLVLGCWIRQYISS